MNRALSFDIGSTYTKAALFDLEADPPELLGQVQAPTTQEDLSHAFTSLLCSLLALPMDTPLSRIRPGLPLYVSSSAKGGLAIAAIGIVPDLTVSVARLAAASAGGRITACFSYRLTSAHVLELERMRPDIVLLCGGTDGGNESFVMNNARVLAASGLDATVLYAGNAALRDDVSGILEGKHLVIAENVMPEVGTITIEPARGAIRRIFLERIIEGRGLARIRTLCSSEPKPTPLAVYELVAALAAGRPDWTETVYVDMGGATTDVYSHSPAFRAEDGTVLRGIVEPTLKRTVEGDLGLRVSARAAAETGGAYIARRLVEEGASREDFSAWVERCAGRPEILARTRDERLFDGILAEACLYYALIRHAGTVEEVWTPGGKIRVQRGKDLRSARRLVASGGLLARLGSPGAGVLRALSAARRDTGGGSLLPESPKILSDPGYLLTLAANLAADHPAQAAAFAASRLIAAEEAKDAAGKHLERNLPTGKAARDAAAAGNSSASAAHGAASEGMERPPR
jgi:uncharacterized protein (TIGR01319 family)